MKRVLAFLGLVLIPSSALGVTEITDVGPKGPPHVFVIPAGQDSTYNPGDFDYNGDGKRDLDRITAIGYRGSSGTDTLRVNVENRGIFLMTIPPTAIDSWSWHGTPIPEIIGDADSTVIRYVNTGIGAAYLYVWGN